MSRVILMTFKNVILAHSLPECLADGGLVLVEDGVVDEPDAIDVKRS